MVGVLVHWWRGPGPYFLGLLIGIGIGYGMGQIILR